MVEVGSDMKKRQINLRVTFIEKKIIVIVLFLYTIISVMREYQILNPIGVFGRYSRYILLLIFGYTFLFILVREFNQIVKMIKEYRILFFHMLAILISMIFNLTYIKEYASYLVLITFSLVASIVLKVKYKRVLYMIYFVAGFYTLYSVFIAGDINIANQTRDLFGYQLNRIRLDISGISFSRISTYMGMIAIMWFSIVKNKFYKYFGVIVFITLSISFGKITIIISLFLTFIIFFIIKSMKNKSELIVNFTLLGTFFSSFIVTKIITPISSVPYYDLNSFFNGRISIWKNYIDNIVNGNIVHLMFGSGFFEDIQNSNYIISHPHNQFLGSFYIIGAVGFITYFILWRDAITVVYKSCLQKRDYVDLVILIFILFIQVTDDYIFFTVEPLFLMIFMYVYVSNRMNLKLSSSDNC